MILDIHLNHNININIHVDINMNIDIPPPPHPPTPPHAPRTDGPSMGWGVWGDINIHILSVQKDG